MKKFKLLLIGGLVSVSFYAVSGGIPVFDGVANSQNLQQWAEKLKQWQQTVQQYKSELQVANDQLNTLKGVKEDIANFNLNGLIRDITALDNITPSYDSIVNGKWSSEANTIAKKLGIDARCETSITNSKLYNLCKSESLNLASSYVTAEKVNEQVNIISKKIATLSKRSATAEDIKTSADINNQIMSYNNQLETLDRKLSLAQRQYTLNNDLIAKQKEQAIKDINSQSSTQFFNSLDSRIKNSNTSYNDGF